MLFTSLPSFHHTISVVKPSKLKGIVGGVTLWASIKVGKKKFKFSKRGGKHWGHCYYSLMRGIQVTKRGQKKNGEVRTLCVKHLSNAILTGVAIIRFR
jgi:hypothetical protein